MKSIGFQDLSDAEWNALCDASPHAWFFHRAEWVRLEERRGGCDANLSFGLVKGGRLVGVLPLYVSSLGLGPFSERLLHCGIHRHTGLALDPALEPGEVTAARGAAMRTVMTLAHRHDVDRIQLNAQNAAPANRGSLREEIPFWVAEHGFHLGLHVTPTGLLPAPGLATCAADHIISLAPSADALFADLDPACRRNVRKAWKLGVTLVLPPTEETVERYYTLAQASQRRTGEALPEKAYFEDIHAAMAPHRIHMLLAVHEGRDVAGLLLCSDKGCLNFMAGVSDPELLHLRPNDFIHWAAMEWGRDNGLQAYRLGPSFPELPEDSPVARVSSFKTKFGGDILPVIQGSYFRRPKPYLEAASMTYGECAARTAEVVEAAVAEDVAPQATERQWSADEEVVAHHLRLFGLQDEGLRLGGRMPGRIAISKGRTAVHATAVRGAAGTRVELVLSPSRAFCEALGITASEVGEPSRALTVAGSTAAWSRLRTLHGYTVFSHPAGEAVVADAEGRAAWLWLPVGDGGILLVGTRLGRDLIRLRQGDPAQVGAIKDRAAWGFDYERPNYLFDAQNEGQDKYDRPADWLARALAGVLADRAGLALQPLLPENAIGAVILTGDDDQAYLSKYEGQQALLQGTPITYFLHPLTRHTPTTLKALTSTGNVDLGLHPDALEAPQLYSKLMDEQANWFCSLTGQSARSLRNHGFLNDGYWGHLKSWLKHGVTISSNIPGLDGRVVNGSLLPARVVMEGNLTDHWSVLTSIGDGVVFAMGMDAAQSADCVLDAAEAIRRDGVPGVLVLNLHPQNVDEARAMHKAALALSQAGFVMWNMRHCVEWFTARDAMAGPADVPGPRGPASIVVTDPFARGRSRLGRLAKRVLKRRGTDEDDTGALAWRRRYAWADPLQDGWHSFDRTPWRHPWLTEQNLRTMRDYSRETIAEVMEIREGLPEPTERKYGFVNNIANSLYFRAVALRKQGVRVDVFPHPQDDYVMGAPEWEEFDGCLPRPETSLSKLTAEEKALLPAVNGVYRVTELYSDWSQAALSEMPEFVRVRDYLQYADYLSYLPICQRLQEYDALLTIQAPYLPYLANRPYLTAQAGGDIWFEAARDDLLGRLQRRAFSQARAFLVSNPWSYAHARRYGLTNQLYVPMILDEDIYSPGEDPIRQEWKDASGGTFFVLSTARLDDLIKGTSMALDGFQAFAERHAGARLVLSKWGADQERHLAALRERGIADRVISLPLSGKRRLIRYLRSADCLLDQFVIGYFGATALEGMACGLPVIMRLETAQYDALCETGAPPVLNASTSGEIQAHLEMLATNPERKAELSAAVRRWFVDNHGSRRWSPVYEAMLAYIAAGRTLDYSTSPLTEPLGEDEVLYHQSELAAAPVYPNYS